MCKNMKKNIFLFAGQGSQYYHMGEALYNENKVFRRSIERVDESIYQLTGEHMIDILYDVKKSSQEPFDHILYTHPCIFMTEYALVQMIMNYDVYPDYVLGTSLGELAAACTAGIVNPEDAALATVRQAQCFQETCEKGGMLAVLESYDLFESMKEVFRNTDLAAINYDEHFVVSGLEQDIRRAEKFLRKRQITCAVLPVSYGFHSLCIDQAKDRYMEFLSNIIINKPRFQMISCVTGEEISQLKPEYFWNVARKPIMFQKAIRYMECKGTYNYVDLSLGGTLAGFTKRIIRSNSKSSVYAIETPFLKIDKSLPNLISNLKRQKKCERSNIGMLAYVFPGQGSQFIGMGAELFQMYPELTAKADEVLGYSIKDLCLNGPEQKLNDTAYTQPALYVVNAFMYMKELESIGVVPDYVAGHSLGEYDALFAAGAFSFEDGLRLVKKRGELMNQVKNGAMAAVTQVKIEEIKEIIQKHNLNSIDVANYNSPIQTVISGRKQDILDAKSIFENEGVGRYVVLRVSGAFHSRYMKEAANEFKNYIKTFQFQDLKIPVISNVNARPYRKGEEKVNLVQQMYHSVQWTDTVRYLIGKGDIQIKQIGPGSVLTGLDRVIMSKCEPIIDADEGTMNGMDVTSNVNKDVGEDEIDAVKLGNKEFKKEYGLRYAYVAGGMYKGISSKEMVVAMGKKRMLAFLGTGGMKVEQVRSDIEYIQNMLQDGEPYGMNFIHNPADPEAEEKLMDLFLEHGVTKIEASAFMYMTPALVKYRLKGLYRDEDGNVKSKNHVMAKLSRPEVAEVFLEPAPVKIVERLLTEGKITAEQAELSKKIAMADDITAEADSGGHTDGAVAYALLPAIIHQKDRAVEKNAYSRNIRIGAAGGIGTPEAAAAAFIMGADYIVTGSINQCTVEAATSNVVKDMLQEINVQDTDYAPAGDMFEMGAKAQVLKRGVFFPARANKLYELYKQYTSLKEIPDKVKSQLEKKYFKKSFDEVFSEIKQHCSEIEVNKALENEKYKMSLIFKWYFAYSTRIALAGDENGKVDFQIPCGPALGAFNQWVTGTDIQDWRNRHVDEIALKIMDETAHIFQNTIKKLSSRG